MCGLGQLAQTAKWPEFDEAKCVEDTVEIAVQVNGKLRAKLTVATGAGQRGRHCRRKGGAQCCESAGGQNHLQRDLRAGQTCKYCRKVGKMFTIIC